LLKKNWKKYKKQMPENIVVNKPSQDEYPAYYHTYIKLVDEDNGIEALEKGLIEMKELISSIPAEKEMYRYAPGKWTVKEVLGHMVDTERVMSYRAMSFARAEKSKLPAFEEDDYVKEANFSGRSLASIVEEFEHLRHSNISLFKSFDAKILKRKGIANEKEISVRALMYILTGHQRHHTQVLRTRYLPT
jgi:hypothetical protein